MSRFVEHVGIVWRHYTRKHVGEGVDDQMISKYSGRFVLHTAYNPTAEL